MINAEVLAVLFTGSTLQRLASTRRLSAILLDKRSSSCTTALMRSVSAAGAAMPEIALFELARLE